MALRFGEIVLIEVLRILICLASIAGCAAAQVNDCPSPEAVLHRYIEAVGGKAVNDIQTRTITTHESNKGYGAEPEHYVYRFKWKAPDKVVATNTPYLLNHLPVHYPNGAFIYDGDSWSDFMGHKSRMHERDPQWQRDLRKYPYNEDPQFLEFHVIADPLMLTRAGQLYSSFEVSTELSRPGDVCVLLANGVDTWRNQRQDILSFDAVSGLLKAWKIQAGTPLHKSYVQFQFRDYRVLGAIKFPFEIYFDLYDATFRYISVVQNKPVADSEFREKPARY